MFGSSVSLIWCHFHSCYLSNCLFAEKFSNCSNSLNFEAKINCNSIKSNVPKWRKICIGLKFDLVHFNGPQTKFINLYPFEGPCILDIILHTSDSNEIYLHHICIYTFHLPVKASVPLSIITARHKQKDLPQCTDRYVNIMSV